MSCYAAPFGAAFCSPHANLLAANIKSGVSIFGVEGSYSGPELLCSYINGINMGKSGSGTSAIITLELYFPFDVSVLSKYFCVGENFPEMSGYALCSLFDTDYPIVFLDGYDSRIYVVFPKSNTNLYVLNYYANHLTAVETSPYSSGYSRAVFKRTGIGSTDQGYIGNDVDTTTKYGSIVLAPTGTPINVYY